MRVECTIIVSPLMIINMINDKNGGIWNPFCVQHIDCHDNPFFTPHHSIWFSAYLGFVGNVVNHMTQMCTWYMCIFRRHVCRINYNSVEVAFSIMQQHLCQHMMFDVLF
jgi:hypothetical protein